MNGDSVKRAGATDYRLPTTDYKSHTTTERYRSLPKTSIMN